MDTIDLEIEMKKHLVTTYQHISKLQDAIISLNNRVAELEKRD